MAERHRTLDALRGVAVMGILLINIIAFALPDAAAYNPKAAGLRTSADLWAWAVDFVLIEGKMRALFSFLFGASMLLVIERAEAEGRGGSGVHLARMAVLLVIGLLHFVLLWQGDILHHYALVGIVALLFVRASTSTIVRAAVLCFALTASLYAVTALGITALRHDAHRSGAPVDVVRSWQAIEAQFGATSTAKPALQLRSYSDQVAARVTEGSADAVQILMFTGVETLGLMLLGMWGLRSGFVTGAWPRERYRRWAIVSYAIGLPPLIVLAAVTWRSNFEPVTVFASGYAGSAPFRPVVMLGHAATMLYVLKGKRDWLAQRIEAAGRAAFSNYLGTTVLMTTLFNGYGLGLFGALSRLQAYAVVPVVWGLMLLWSKPWLDRYRYGPAEWLWRSLARGRAQPMRIT